MDVLVNWEAQHRPGTETTPQPGFLACHFAYLLGADLCGGENGPGERVVMEGHPSQGG